MVSVRGTEGTASGPPGPVPDPTRVRSRAALGAALTALRHHAGLTVRAAASASGVLHGTLAGWFAGNHVPTSASRAGYVALLEACGVTGPDAQQLWWDAADRARRATRRTTAASPYLGLEAYEAPTPPCSAAVPG